MFKQDKNKNRMNGTLLLIMDLNGAILIRYCKMVYYLLNQANAKHLMVKNMEKGYMYHQIKNMLLNIVQIQKHR